MVKNPANRHALPKVIISEVDNNNILEFKIKYEKLARLDKVEVKSMHFDDNKQVVFDEVVINGGLIEPTYEDKHKKLVVTAGEKSYSIVGQKVGGKPRLLEDRVSKTKVQLELTNYVEDKEGKKRVSKTERELIVADNIELYSQIVGREVKTTKEIYLIKRFLEYRSDLLFYYGFVDNFFKVAGNGKELWKIDFTNSDSLHLIEYFKFSINDNLKNDENYLKNYVSENTKIENDLVKCQNNFNSLRHALMHFDYDFFEKLFNGENVGFDFDIEFLNIMIDKVDKLNIDTKKEFIDDEEVTLFGEALSLKKLYGLFSHIAINRVAFNKLINSFIIEDGIENKELKDFFNNEKGSQAYEIDIHSNAEYKALYVQHKKLVMATSAMTDGDEIAKKNQEISDLKEKMKVITKENSLARLEHKLRLAFGFIYTEYKDYKTFKKHFDQDIKGAKYKGLNVEKLKEYYETTLKNSKPKTDEKLEDVAKKIDKLSLKELIDDDILLKFVLLLFIFMPQELKGDFLGFIKKYYHDKKHIDQDTKDKDTEIEELSTGLKLKVLDKNIRSLSILKHSLSFQVKYNKKDKNFYEDGNLHGKFYKKLSISHNQEEFNKSVYAPLFRYYSALYKLINNFEIYALAQHVENHETLADQVNKSQFIQKSYFNFRKLLDNTDSISQSSSYNTLIVMRNNISHLSYEPLFNYPLDERKSYKKKTQKGVKTFHVEPLYISRAKIIELISLQTDMKKLLGYDAVNDFNMKVVHLRKRLSVYANKEESIRKMQADAKTPNDFYNIYKVKGVESINQHLLKVIGATEAEKSIEKQINEGNKKHNT